MLSSPFESDPVRKSHFSRVEFNQLFSAEMRLPILIRFIRRTCLQNSANQIAVSAFLRMTYTRISSFCRFYRFPGPGPGRRWLW